jgi:hypothetical protein
MSVLSPVQNRRQLRDLLENNLRSETQLEEEGLLEEEPAVEKQEEFSRKRTKAQILEANASFSDYVNMVHSTFSFAKSDDSTLWNVMFSGSLVGYLDTAHPRLWILHSIGPADEMRYHVKYLTRDGNMLDVPWFASSMLSDFGEFGAEGAGFNLKFKNYFKEGEAESPVEDMTMRFWGSAAFDLIQQLRSSNRIKGGLSLNGIGFLHRIEQGYVKEQVYADGYVMALRGNSIDSHFSLIDKIRQHYMHLLQQIESEFRLSYEKHPNGIQLKGNALTVAFERRISDLDAFAEFIFSTNLPFRLWGIKKSLASDYMKVNAVDLHTGGRIDFEIDPESMRIYLRDDACGNVVARLFTNLQSSFDAQSQLLGMSDERII